MKEFVYADFDGELRKALPELFTDDLLEFRRILKEILDNWLKEIEGDRIVAVTIECATMVLKAALYTEGLSIPCILKSLVLSLQEMKTKEADVLIKKIKEELERDWQDPRTKSKRYNREALNL